VSYHLRRDRLLLQYWNHLRHGVVLVNMIHLQTYLDLLTFDLPFSTMHMHMHGDYLSGSGLWLWPFLQILPTVASFSSSRLTPQIPRTVYRYFWAIRFLRFSFSVFLFLVVGSVLLIKLTHVGFWAHVKIASRIVSYRCVALSAIAEPLVHFFQSCTPVG